MTDYPSESSLIVNATQQQLSMSRFKSGIAIAPSNREEAKGGYDVTFDTATRIELQYKAVYNKIENRTFKPGCTETAVKFPFNGDQAKTLLGRQPGPGTAFYALPVVLNLSGIGKILDSTIFVDVAGLESLPKKPDNFEEYTAFWVPVIGTTPTFSEVYLKDKQDPRYSNPQAYDCIKRKYLYSWREFERLTSANINGVPVRIGGESSPAGGYQQLLKFESRLLQSNFSDSVLDEVKSEQIDESGFSDSVVDKVVQQSINVGESIGTDRQERALSTDLWEILERHEYLLNQEFDRERRKEAVKAALINNSVEEEEEIQIDESGLDPRQGFQHRQYRYLTSGEQAETLEIPIGFL